MVTVRFNGHKAVPKKIRVGVETDNLVEKVSFELPEIGENQKGYVYVSDGEEHYDVIALENGVWDVGENTTQATGKLTAFARVKAGKATWNSEPFYVRIVDLPDVEGGVEQAFPSAVQTALDALAGAMDEVGEAEGRVGEAEARINGAIDGAEEAMDAAVAGVRETVDDVARMKGALACLSVAADAEILNAQFVSGEYRQSGIRGNTSRACAVISNVSKNAKVFFDQTKYALTYFYVRSESDWTLINQLGGWNTSGVMELGYANNATVVLQVKDTVDDSKSLVDRLPDINSTTVVTNIRLYNGAASGASLSDNSRPGFYSLGSCEDAPVSGFADMPASDFAGGWLLNIPVGASGNEIVQILKEVNGESKTGRTFERNADGSWADKGKCAWLAYGDSITFGSYSTPEGGTQAGPTRGYAYRIANQLRRDRVSQFYNCAVRGIGWINTGNNGETLEDMLTSFTGDKSGITLLTIMLGINDYLSKERIGTTGAEEKDGTISGNIRYCLRWCCENFPNAKIVVISPINSTMYGSGASAWARRTRLNAPGSLDDVANMIKYWCDYFGVRFVNELSEGFINAHNATNYLKDGIHPTNEGQWMLAADLADKLV